MTDAVENTIRNLNQLWLGGDYVHLGALLDEHAVLLPPNAAQLIAGREAIVDGYRRFAEMGGVHEFEFVDITSYTFADTAVCHRRFNIEFETGERRFQESGIENYTLRRDSKDWKIVWRTRVGLQRE